MVEPKLLLSKKQGTSIKLNLTHLQSDQLTHLTKQKERLEKELRM
jgi:hypothetical protein